MQPLLRAVLTVQFQQREQHFTDITIDSDKNIIFLSHWPASLQFLSVTPAHCPKLYHINNRPDASVSEPCLTTWFLPSSIRSIVGGQVCGCHSMINFEHVISLFMHKRNDNRVAVTSKGVCHHRVHTSKHEKGYQKGDEFSNCHPRGTWRNCWLHSYILIPYLSSSTEFILALLKR